MHLIKSVLAREAVLFIETNFTDKVIKLSLLPVNMNDYSSIYSLYESTLTLARFMSHSQGKTLSFMPIKLLRLQ